jgi:hypothetical protein
MYMQLNRVEVSSHLSSNLPDRLVGPRLQFDDLTSCSASDSFLQNEILKSKIINNLVFCRNSTWLQVAPGPW